MKTDRSVVPNRPRTQLNEDEKKKVLQVLSQGLSKRDAARTVGCHISTINSAIARDPEFALAAQQSQIDPIVHHLAIIQEAGKKSWRASAWYLEHMYPERFVKRKPDHLSIDEAKGEMEEIMRHMMPSVPKHRRAEVRQKFRQLREDWANGVETPLEEEEEESVFGDDDVVEIRAKTAEMSNDEGRMTKEEQVVGAVPERHGASRRFCEPELSAAPPAASAVPLKGTTRGRDAPALRTGAGGEAGAVQEAGKAGAMPPRAGRVGQAAIGRPSHHGLPAMSHHSAAQQAAPAGRANSRWDSADRPVADGAPNAACPHPTVSQALP